eukprot:m.359649 g.359649  ORF g.359649 m.359649 type:complete len:225 (-) comp16632_c0_seq3:816-1490(-)
MEGEPIKVSVSIIGCSGCGKTSLFNRFTLGEYATNPTITIGMDYRTKELTMTDPSTGKEVTVRVDVWDTAGMERYRSSVKSLYRSKDCVLVAYDITETGSFEEMQTLMQFLETTCGEDSVLAAVATKIDLEGKRKVPREAAQQWAEDNDMKHYEVSSKSGAGVDQLFTEMVTAVLRRQAQTPARQPFIDLESPFSSAYDRRIAEEISSPVPSDFDEKVKRGKCC